MAVSTYSCRFASSATGLRSRIPQATSFFNRAVSRLREISSCFWKSSNRVVPPKASRRIMRLPQSPRISTDRAIGHSAKAQLFRCMGRFFHQAQAGLGNFEPHREGPIRASFLATRFDQWPHVTNGARLLSCAPTPSKPISTATCILPMDAPHLEGDVLASLRIGASIFDVTQDGIYGWRCITIFSLPSWIRWLAPLPASRQTPARVALRSP